MLIQKLPITQIKAAAYNPRKISDAEYAKLKKSIETFGYIDPVVVNQRTGNLVGGHMRLRVLIEQGVQEVDVSIVDLDLANEKLLNLALNKISGEWDQNSLAQLLDELNKTEGIDISLAGFDTSEISQVLDRAEEVKEDNFNGDINSDENAITCPGDLIELGEHRILCGDSSKLEDIEKLLGGHKADLLFTDPPYNVNYDGKNRPVSESSQGNWRKIANDHMPQAEYEQWLRQVLKNAGASLAPGAVMYVWNGTAQFGPMHQMMREEGFHVSCVITWVKETFAWGYSDYHQQGEFCLHAWKEHAGAHNWYGPDNETTVWQIKREATASYIHPTQKPVALAHRAIKNSSKRGDIVLDLFLGSGTTLIAAELLHRRCHGMEMDPLYCDAIVKRYVQLVGKEKINQDVLNKYSL